LLKYLHMILPPSSNLQRCLCINQKEIIPKMVLIFFFLTNRHCQCLFLFIITEIINKQHWEAIYRKERKNNTNHHRWQQLISLLAVVGDRRRLQSWLCIFRIRSRLHNAEKADVWSFTVVRLQLHTQSTGRFHQIQVPPGLSRSNHYESMACGDLATFAARLQTSFSPRRTQHVELATVVGLHVIKLFIVLPLEGCANPPHNSKVSSNNKATIKFST
jgi:hypothetical protein